MSKNINYRNLIAKAISDGTKVRKSRLKRYNTFDNKEHKRIADKVIKLFAKHVKEQTSEPHASIFRYRVMELNHNRDFKIPYKPERNKELYLDMLSGVAKLVYDALISSNVAVEFQVTYPGPDDGLESEVVMFGSWKI